MYIHITQCVLTYYYVYVPEDAFDFRGEVAAILPPLDALCMMAIEPGILAGLDLSPRVIIVGPRPPPPSILPP